MISKHYFITLLLLNAISFLNAMEINNNNSSNFVIKANQVQVGNQFHYKILEIDVLTLKNDILKVNNLIIQNKNNPNVQNQVAEAQCLLPQLQKIYQEKNKELTEAYFVQILNPNFQYLVSAYHNQFTFEKGYRLINKNSPQICTALSSFINNSLQCVNNEFLPCLFDAFCFGLQEYKILFTKRCQSEGLTLLVPDFELLQEYYNDVAKQSRNSDIRFDTVYAQTNIYKDLIAKYHLNSYKTYLQNCEKIEKEEILELDYTKNYIHQTIVNNWPTLHEELSQSTFSDQHILKQVPNTNTDNIKKITIIDMELNKDKIFNLCSAMTFLQTIDPHDSKSPYSYGTLYKELLISWSNCSNFEQWLASKNSTTGILEPGFTIDLMNEGAQKVGRAIFNFAGLISKINNFWCEANNMQALLNRYRSL